MENRERTFGLSLTKLLRGYSWMSGSLCFFPDGRSLAVSTETNTLDIWDVEQQIKLSTFPLEPGQCSSMTFVPGGLRVAFGGPGTIARVLSLDGGCLAEFSGHQRRIRSLVFSHDGTHLVTLDVSGTLRIWRIPTNQLVLLFPTVPPEERISELSEGNPPLLVLSPDDRLLLVKWRSCSGKIQAWDVDLTHAQARWKGGFLAGEPRLNSLAFSPDGRVIGALTYEDHLDDFRFYDPQTFTLLKRVRIPAAWEFSLEILDAAFSPDGRLVALADSQGMLGIWDNMVHEPLAIFRVFPSNGGGPFYPFTSVAWSPDGQLLATAGWEPDHPVDEGMGMEDFVVKLWVIIMAKKRVVKLPFFVDFHVHYR